MKFVDLNCDLGESFGAYKIGNDEKVLENVSSVNIACGFHAGDPVVMNKTVKNAIENNVAIGAHPGFLDLVGFGRRKMHISLEEAENYIVYQVSALQGFVKSYGGTLQHVKPHGALYNMAAVDLDLALAIAKGVKRVDENLILMGLAGSKLIEAGKMLDLKVASEVFADRAYTDEGTLVPRSMEGAVIKDPELAVKRAINMFTNNYVESINGKKLTINADTICVHGDNEEALNFVRKIKAELEASGLKIANLTETK